MNRYAFSRDDRDRWERRLWDEARALVSRAANAGPLARERLLALREHPNPRVRRLVGPALLRIDACYQRKKRQRGRREQRASAAPAPDRTSVFWAPLTKLGALEVLRTPQMRPSTAPMIAAKMSVR